MPMLILLRAKEEGGGGWVEQKVEGENQSGRGEEMNQDSTFQIGMIIKLIA